MACPLLPIHPNNPEPRKLAQALNVISNGGIIICPTDTVYGIACNLMNRKAVDRIIQIVGIKPQKFQLSFLCNEISQVAQYVQPMSTQVFKILKHTLPGPFTYILPAAASVSRIAGVNKKTVGIRIPNHRVPRELVQALGHPIVTSSVKDLDPLKEYTTDPEEIHAAYKHVVDLVIDSGVSGNVPSTVVDLTAETPVIVREGLGDFAF